MNTLTPEDIEPPSTQAWWSSGGTAQRAAGFAVPDVTSRRNRHVGVQVIVLLSGAAVIVGSLMPWVRSTLEGHHGVIRGSSHAIRVVAHINGTVTLIGGCAMVVLAIIGIITAWPLLRFLQGVAAIATAAATAYATVRIIQRIDRVGHHLHTLTFGPALRGPIRLDYGLIVVIAGSAVGLIAALAAAGRSS